MGLHEGIILGKMARLRLSRQVLSRLIGARESGLCRGLRGIEPLPNAELLRIDALLTDLEALQTLVQPLELPIYNILSIGVLLQKFRDGELVGLVNPEIAAGLVARIANHN